VDLERDVITWTLRGSWKIDGHEQWNSIQRGRRIQEELALELHAKARVPLHQCGIEDVQTFQRFLVGYQIHVISREYFNGIAYHGPTAGKKIYLYYHDNHYDVITSMTAFLSRIYFCTNCYKGYKPKKNTLATTYAIIVGNFTIKLKMIGYIVMIVNDISKDQHALISIRRRRHWETQHVPHITNIKTADNPWTNEWEIIPVGTSIVRLVKIIIHLNTSVTCYLWITTTDRRNRLTSFSILNVRKMTWSHVNKDTNRMTTENVFIANHRGVELSNISLIYV
jgi:hypothetical protein